MTDEASTGSKGTAPFWGEWYNTKAFPQRDLETYDGMILDRETADADYLNNQAARIRALEVALRTEREKTAGWLCAACKNCDLTIGQMEPGIWLHLYGPMIGQPRCNTLHGAESDHAEPDERYHNRVRAALRSEGGD